VNIDRLFDALAVIIDPTGSPAAQRRAVFEAAVRWFAAEDPFTMPSVDPYALVLDELVSAIDDSDRVLAALSDAAPYDHKEHAVRHALMKARARLEARS